MANATWEEAQRCSSCSSVGTLVNSTAGKNGATMKTLECPSEVCPWRDTERNGGKGLGFRWVVQVEKDGTIPLREDRGPKQFELPKSLKSAADRQIEQAMEQFRGADGEIHLPGSQ